MSNKLRIMLRNWLLKDEIKELNRVIRNQEQAQEYIREARDIYFRAANSLALANETVGRCLDIGADVYTKQPSWAVICIKGKPETVRFMEFDQHSAHELREFLRHFEFSNVIIDSPFRREFFKI